MTKPIAALLALLLLVIVLAQVSSDREEPEVPKPLREVPGIPPVLLDSSHAPRPRTAVTVEEGESLASVAGTIVLGRIDPSAKCIVRVIDAEHPHRAFATSVLGGGEFTCRVARPGRYDVVVEARRHGRKRLENVRVEGSTTLLEPIRLDSSGDLAVRVLQPDGRAVVGLPLHARLDAETKPREGWPRSSATTDAEGYADFPGLAAGLYHLRVTSLASDPGPRRRAWDITAEPLAADGERKTIVYGDPQILVRLIGLNDDERRWVPPKNVHPAPWPPAPVVEVRALAPDWHEVLGAPLRPLAQTGGERRFRVTPGREYRVSVRGGRRATQHVEVKVPLGAGCVDVNVVLGRPTEVGTLVLELPGKAPFDTSAESIDRKRCEWFEVAIDDATSRVWTTHVVRSTQDRASYDLPAGVYWVDVAGRVMSADVPRRFGRQRARVTLVGGKTTSLVLASDACARLEIDARIVGELRFPKEERGRSWPDALRVWLDDQDGYVEQVVFEGFENRIGNPIRLPYVADELLSTPVPAGRYRLTALLRDDRFAQCDVSLVPDRTTQVQLEFPSTAD